MSAVGLYVLLLELHRERRLRVGALGVVHLPAGRYLYTGSARRALAARVARHLRGRKAVHWHVDYLTTRRDCTREGAALVVGAPGRPAAIDECALNQLVARSFGAAPVVPGFGASDCRGGCGAHLLRTDRTLTLVQLGATLADRVDPRLRVTTCVRAR